MHHPTSPLWPSQIQTAPLGIVSCQIQCFAVFLAGPGDLLAAFRCLSCTYTFTTDRRQLTRMGAPGRVFATGEVKHWNQDRPLTCEQTVALLCDLHSFYLRKPCTSI